MSAEEKTPSESESGTHANFSGDSPVQDPAQHLAQNSANSEISEPVEAMLVSETDDDATESNAGEEIPHAMVVEALLVTQKASKISSPPPISRNLDNIAANGGAVAAFVLGAWSLVGAFITNWSIINGMLGLLLGFWGLKSRRRKLAWLGILLCLLSIFLNVFHVSEIVNTYLNPIDENPY